MALAALALRGRDLEQAGKVAIVHADQRSPAACSSLSMHEQPRLGLDRADDFGEARPQRRIGAVHRERRRHETRDVLHRDMVDRLGQVGQCRNRARITSDSPNRDQPCRSR